MKQALDHARVAELRGFSSTDEMNDTLIQKWNARVTPKDTVYILGDFCISSYVSSWQFHLKCLHDQKHLVKGNHDSHRLLKKLAPFNLFQSVQPYKEIKIPDDTAPHGKRLVVLCHYAFRVWRNSHHGSFHCYGHSHGNLLDDPHARSLDVGVDCHGLAPISYEEVRTKLLQKEWRPVDHHQ